MFFLCFPTPLTEQEAQIEPYTDEQIKRFSPKNKLALMKAQH